MSPRPGRRGGSQRRLPGRNSLALARTPAAGSGPPTPHLGLPAALATGYSEKDVSQDPRGRSTVTLARNAFLTENGRLPPPGWTPPDPVRRSAARDGIGRTAQLRPASAWAPDAASCHWVMFTATSGQGGYLSDERILGADPFTTCGDHDPGGQGRTRAPHSRLVAAASGRISERVLPSPRFQPARRHREEKVRPAPYTRRPDDALLEKSGACRTC